MTIFLGPQRNLSACKNRIDRALGGASRVSRWGDRSAGGQPAQVPYEASIYYPEARQAQWSYEGNQAFIQRAVQNGEPIGP